MSWNWEVHGGLFKPQKPISKTRDVSKSTYQEKRNIEIWKRSR